MVQRKTVWMAAFCLLLAGCSNGHDSLSKDVQAIGFEDSFEFLVERRVGPEQCLLADCPAILRYYLSDQGLVDACEAVGELLEGTAVVIDRTLGDESCRFLGLVGNVRLDVRSTDPISEIPPDDQTLNPFQVTDAHESSVVVRATRDE